MSKTHVTMDPGKHYWQIKMIKIRSSLIWGSTVVMNIYTHTNTQSSYFSSLAWNKLIFPWQLTMLNSPIETIVIKSGLSQKWKWIYVLPPPKCFSRQQTVWNKDSVRGAGKKLQIIILNPHSFFVTVTFNHNVCLVGSLTKDVREDPQSRFLMTWHWNCFSNCDNHCYCLWVPVFFLENLLPNRLVVHFLWA